MFNTVLVGDHNHLKVAGEYLHRRQSVVRTHWGGGPLWPRHVSIELLDASPRKIGHSRNESSEKKSSVV